MVAHESIITIKSQVVQNPQYADIYGFTLRKVSPSDIDKIMKNLNTKTAIGYDTLPAKLASSDIATPLANILSNSIQQCKLPTACKAPEVLPIHNIIHFSA